MNLDKIQLSKHYKLSPDWALNNVFLSHSPISQLYYDSDNNGKIAVGAMEQ